MTLFLQNFENLFIFYQNRDQMPNIRLCKRNKLSTPMLQPVTNRQSLHRVPQDRINVCVNLVSKIRRRMFQQSLCNRSRNSILGKQRTERLSQVMEFQICQPSIFVIESQLAMIHQVAEQTAPIRYQASKPILNHQQNQFYLICDLAISTTSKLNSPRGIVTDSLPPTESPTIASPTGD